jgi:Uncharacterized protein containing a TIR (Toll-Interleukin 1-resistance) domain
MDKKEYDVALSFAGENREYVERVAKYLKNRGINVFYDMFEQASLWGKDLYSYLDDIYQHRARYCIVFLSEHYASKNWTRHEMGSAFSRAFTEREEYLLPVKIDDIQLPGVRITTGYIDARMVTPEEIAELFINKVSLQNNNLTLQNANKINPKKHGKYFSYGGGSKDFNNAMQYYDKGELSEAINYLNKAILANNAYAMAFLGYMYRDGNYVEKDYSKAVELWSKSISTTQIPVSTYGLSIRSFIELNLGGCYLWGQGTTQDYSLAQKYYSASAKGGNLRAMMRLGNIYRDGLGVEQDYKQAAIFYAQLAVVETNNLSETEIINQYVETIGEAQYQLALLYKDGLGVVKNIEKAKEWFQCAVSNGHKKAKFELEIMQAFSQ